MLWVLLRLLVGRHTSCITHFGVPTRQMSLVASVSKVVKCLESVETRLDIFQLLVYLVHDRRSRLIICLHHSLDDADNQPEGSIDNALGRSRSGKKEQRLHWRRYQV